MPRKGTNLLATIIAALLLILAGYFLYLMVVTSDQTRLAVLTAVISVGTLVYTQNKNTQREIDGRQFSKRSEAYEQIFQIIFDAMKQGDDAKDTMKDKIESIFPKLMIWGGPDVLTAWLRLSTPTGDLHSALVSGNGLLMALRKELGHSRDDELGPMGILNVMLRADDRHQIDELLTS